MQGFHFTVAKNTYTFNHLHMRTTPLAHAHYFFCTCALLLLHMRTTAFRKNWAGCKIFLCFPILNGKQILNSKTMIAL